jgi:hypothetical protein
MPVVTVLKRTHSQTARRRSQRTRVRSLQPTALRSKAERALDYTGTAKKDFVYFVIQTLIIGGNRLSMALFPPPPSRRSLRFLEKRRESFLFLGRAGRFRVFIFGGKKGFRHVDMHGTVVACSKRVIVADMLNAADEAT